MDIVTLDASNNSEAAERAVSVLKSGGVAIVPTDTIYGLIADTENIAAVQKIFKMKKRPEGKTFPLFVASIEAAGQIAAIAPHAKKILKNFWPGKLTAVLKAKPEAKEWLAREDGTIAIRVPRHPFLLRLLDQFGRPMTETSVNIWKMPTREKISDMVSDFESSGRKPDLIIDAGDLPDSLPSTVVDFTVMPPVILREGAISREELEQISGMIYTREA